MKDLVANKGRFRRAVKLIRLARVPLYRRGLRLGIGATIEHVDVPLGPGYRTVIDVGAHHGQFALFAAHMYPAARIYCVEPHRASCARLGRLAEIVPQITLLPFAAAERSGDASLHISRKSDSSSLLSIMNSYTAAFPGTDEVGTAIVETRPLDQLLNGLEMTPPVLLKIDVQGTELSVLRGASRTLARVDAVLVECSFAELYRGQALAGDVVAHLNEQFFLEGVFGLVRDRRGQCLQADLLFRRKGVKQ
jgi:FkbM family methyltransferase